jgi:hypothetical protein
MPWMRETILRALHSARQTRTVSQFEKIAGASTHRASSETCPAHNTLNLLTRDFGTKAALPSHAPALKPAALGRSW